MAEGGLLHTIADAAAIATFIIAAVAAFYAVRDFVELRYRKRRKLEDYLRHQKELAHQQNPPGHTMFTAFHIARYVKINVDEAVKLSFDNPGSPSGLNQTPTTMRKHSSLNTWRPENKIPLDVAETHAKL
jgi:hypothetical protein